MCSSKEYWPASHLWHAGSQVGDAGTPKQPELPGQNLSLPFHCSTPGRATDWSCEEPILKLYITKTTRAKWIPSIKVPSPQRPLLGKYLYFCAIYHSNLAFAMLKLDYITNKSDLELAAILISAKKDRH